MKKIEELERRIRELEARPVYVPIYIGSPQPSYPCHQPLPYWHQPWIAPQPIWAGMGIGGTPTVTTCGAATMPASSMYVFTGNEQLSYTN